jgi:hypothetical protein
MIILHEKMGQQLGNRLTLFSHFIAFAERSQIFIVYPAFDEYSTFFEGTINNPFCQYPLKLSFPNASKFHSNYIFITKLIYYKLNVPNLSKFFPLVRDIRLQNLDERLFVVDDCLSKNNCNIHKTKLLREFGVNFFEGWRFRDFESVTQYFNKIREFFKPTFIYTQQVNHFINKERNQNNLLIGFHIRLGDYKQQAPQWYYSLEFYKNLVQHITLLFKPINIKIIIASNEDLYDHFSDIYNVSFCPKDIIVDLYILSQCDYIIGAPSTYSEWAAFYGQKPYYRLLSEGSFPQINDFQIIDAIGRDF